jgi:nucleotide-binding universal stress UspA family protein
MSQLRRIVVGYNFSPDGELALRSAFALAERSQATLYLLHVVEPYPIYVKMRFPTAPAEAAAEIDADLVVIGTHGRSGLAHMLLGSVAEQILRSTSCSALAVRPNAFRFELP